MNGQLQRMVGAAAVTLAVSLAVAAQALAGGGGVYPNDRAGNLGVGNGPAQKVTAPDAFERAVLRADRPLHPDDRAGLRWHGESSIVGVYPDDRAGLRWHGESSIVGVYADDRAGLRWHGESGSTGIYPDDRVGVRGPGPTSASPAPLAATGSEAFQWGAAAMGAGCTLALMLFAAAAMVSLRHRRHMTLS